MEILDLKPKDHMSEKKTNATQSLINTENVNNDLRKNEGNNENGQIDFNQKIDLQKQ